MTKEIFGAMNDIGKIMKVAFDENWIWLIISLIIMIIINLILSHIKYGNE